MKLGSGAAAKAMVAICIAAIFAVNTATHAVSAAPTVGEYPQGISVSPTGTEVYVANQGSNSVSVISTSSNAVTYTIAVGSSPFAYGNFLR